MTTKFQILRLSGFKREDYFCLGGSGKLNLKMEFYLGLECITITMNVGNWCPLRNTEQSDLVEVCRDLITNVKLERLERLEDFGVGLRKQDVL